MVSSTASTVKAYLAALPADRRAAISAVRDVINARLPAGFVETMQYGMISWIVPPSRLAATYNDQPLALASLGAQKRYMALYLMTVYGSPPLATWFRAAFAAAGKRLDMGKSCVRFARLDDLPLDVIGELIARVPLETYVAAAVAARPVKPKPIARARPAKPRPAKPRPAKPRR
jgi:Domain of unknown function (DU1801)